MAVDAKTFLVPGKFQEVLVLQILGKLAYIRLPLCFWYTSRRGLTLQQRLAADNSLSDHWNPPPSHILSRFRQRRGVIEKVERPGPTMEKHGWNLASVVNMIQFIVVRGEVSSPG